MDQRHASSQGPQRTPPNPPSRRDAIATRQALLSASAEVFAEHGYRGARVRDICNRAGVNIGAINRHFGTKEALYLAVVLRAGEGLIAKEKVPTRDDFDSPEDALKAWMKYLLRLLLLHQREDPLAGLILQREFHDPTPAFARFVEMAVLPTHRELLAITQALLNEPSNTPRVRRAAVFVHSTCLFQCVGGHFLEQIGDSIVTDASSVSRKLNTLFPIVLAGVLAA